MGLREKLYNLFNKRKRLNAGPELIKPHKDSNGENVSYYYNTAQGQKENDFASFGSSRLLKEIQIDDENKKFIYIGTISGAGNAIGIIETDILLEEIVKNEQGSSTLTKILQKNYALEKAYDKWNSIDIDYDKTSTMGYFFKPVFFLGNIKGKKEFTIDETMTQYSEKEIKKIESENELQKARRKSDDLKIDLGSSIFIGETTCYKTQTPFKTEYCGVNKEGLKYRYANPKKISTEGKPYVYEGKLWIGSAVGDTISDSGIKNYSKVIIEMENPIDIVFVQDMPFSHKALGDIFSEENLEKRQNAAVCYIGKIEIDKNGFYEFKDSKRPSDKAKKAILKDTTKENSKQSKIIKFNKDRGE